MELFSHLYLLAKVVLSFCHVFLLQRGGGTHRLLYRHRHHAGHGRERGCGGHLQLRQGAALTEGQHGPDRGTVDPIRQTSKNAA